MFRFLLSIALFVAQKIPFSFQVTPINHHAYNVVNCNCCRPQALWLVKPILCPVQDKGPHSLNYASRPSRQANESHEPHEPHVVKYSTNIISKLLSWEKKPWLCIIVWLLLVVQVLPQWLLTHDVPATLTTQDSNPRALSALNQITRLGACSPISY